MNGIILNQSPQKMSTQDIYDLIGYTPIQSVNGKTAENGVININASDIGLGNVTNESKLTMFTSPQFTGNNVRTTTVASTDTSSKVASTAFVASRINYDIHNSKKTFTLPLGTLESDQTAININFNFIEFIDGSDNEFVIVDNPESTVFIYDTDDYITEDERYLKFINEYLKSLTLKTLNGTVYTNMTNDFSELGSYAEDIIGIFINEVSGGSISGAEDYSFRIVLDIDDINETFSVKYCGLFDDEDGAAAPDAGYVARSYFELEKLSGIKNVTRNVDLSVHEAIQLIFNTLTKNNITIEE